MKTRTLMLLATLLTLGSAAFAQEAAPQVNDKRIDQREQNQQKRIAAGEVSGSLTSAEAARLERQQARFERQEHRDRVSGGGLSAQERRQLNREQNRESRAIYRKKHNARTDH